MMNERRRRNERQINRFNNEYDASGFIDSLSEELHYKSLSWFTDEQISQLRKDIVTKGWRSYQAITRSIRMNNMEQSYLEIIDIAEGNIRADYRNGKISETQFRKEMLVVARGRQQELQRIRPNPTTTAS